jgi:hypothetical protein
MDREFDTDDIGGQLGTQGVGSMVNKAEAFCAYRQQDIALTNQPRIVELRAEAALLLDEERDIVARLNLAPPPGDLRSRRRKAFYYWSITAFLTFAGFVFSLYTLEPFQLGLKAYLYCLGVAIIAPFAADQAIEQLNAKLVTASAAVVCSLAALTSLIFLAAIRGDLLAETLRNSSPVVIIDDAPQEPQQSENKFYEKTTPELQLVMILLALAMELGAGLGLHEARRYGAGNDFAEDWDQLRARLKEVRQNLVAIASEITHLETQPAAFHARFWTSFYRAMLTHTLRSAMTKFMLALLVVALALYGRASAQTHTNIVIAVDLSQSVAVRGPDGKSEFQKNIEAVTKQLAQVPADSRVTVIGITGHSFTQPDILLSATIPSDTGYFSQRLNSARQALVREWKVRNVKLSPSYPQTDIFGALLLASQVFNQYTSANRQLIIYSDMRQRTPELDIEGNSSLPTFSKLTEKSQIADLHDVSVLVLGVDGAYKSIGFWQSLLRFWLEYFRESGASVETYSALR